MTNSDILFFLILIKIPRAIAVVFQFDGWRRAYGECYSIVWRCYVSVRFTDALIYLQF